MIKFLSLDNLGVSHRIPRKNKNAVYRLQIPAVVPEILKFEKCINYANEMTDDVIYSTQFYLKYINRGRYLLQVAGCRLQVEKWTFKSE